MSSRSSDTPSLPKAEGLKVYLQPRVIGMLFLGFSAGLPLLLVGGTHGYAIWV